MSAVGSDPRRVEPTNVKFDLRKSKSLVTGHAFSFYLSCHSGAFFNGYGLWAYWITVCACCPAVSEFVIRASFNVNGAAVNEYAIPNLTTWWQCYILIAQMVPNGSSPGESE